MAVEYYTPNFASDADRIAPILASRDVAAGIYVWLHSRVFVSCNSIGISEARLAEIMGCERSSVQRAVKFLEGAGLVKGHLGDGGQPFQSVSLPHQKAVPGGVADGGHDGRRCGEH